ncbi:MAG TPA: GAF domain-containing protein [bacterium]
MAQKVERDPGEGPAGAGSVVRAYNRSKAFVEEVMRENELLRYKVLHLEQELVRSRQEHASRAGDVMSENFQLRRQLEEIKTRFDQLNRQSEDFRERYQEVERQNENLLNLYVSGYQLHSTLDEETALSVVREILLNLVGAEAFALWLVDGASGRMTLLSLTDESGLEDGVRPRIPAEALDSLRAGNSWFGRERRDGDPLCCVPLKLEERTVGAISIHRLLTQKPEFTGLDEEILGLLAAQAAATLIGARLYSRSGQELVWADGDCGAAA